MTSPVEFITVRCPECDTTYDDWRRASVNLNVRDFDEAHIRRASSATCPNCGHVVTLGTIVIRGDVWEVG